MKIPGTPCDVAVTLGDITFGLREHLAAGTSPDASRLRQWLDSFGQAARLHGALAAACEDLIELGVSDSRVAAIAATLTAAQGQDVYTPRADWPTPSASLINFPRMWTRLYSPDAAFQGRTAAEAFLDYYFA